MRGDEPCQCVRSWAYITPVHDGHCCFLPASQTCHVTEVATWENRRAQLAGVAPRPLSELGAPLSTDTTPTTEEV